jgi:hypothetical protein
MLEYQDKSYRIWWFDVGRSKFSLNVEEKKIFLIVITSS